MHNTMSYEQFCDLAKDHDRVVLYHEFPNDMLTPVNAFLSLEGETAGASIIEYTANDPRSYIALHPIAEFKEKKRKNNSADPLKLLRRTTEEYRAAFVHPLSRYCGSPIGFFSYDAMRLFENIPDQHDNHDDIPEIFFKFYEILICFDHGAKKIVVSYLANVTNDLEKCYGEAIETTEAIVSKIICSKKHVDLEDVDTSKVLTDIEDDSYCELIKNAKEYIAKGDIFQVVVSRKFQTTFTGNAFDFYRSLRINSCAPYLFYIDNGSYSVIGASPERLVNVDNAVITVSPIAGTLPIENPDDYERVTRQLLSDDKELAEHTMLIDLARNDIGKVAKPGTVIVKKTKVPQRFHHLIHLISEVEGVALDHVDCFDIFKAVFPAGTLTGAPKIRAMEIIDELETSRRGIYGGAICLIDHAGNLDSFIAIRTAHLKDNLLTVRAGSGIVYDSITQKEADESRHKASSIVGVSHGFIN